MARKTVTARQASRRYFQMKSNAFLVAGGTEYAHATIVASVTTIKLSANFRCRRGKQSGSVVQRVNGKCMNALHGKVPRESGDGYIVGPRLTDPRKASPTRHPGLRRDDDEN